MNQVDDLKVFISNRDSVCDECHAQLVRNAWLLLTRERGALCLAGEEVRRRRCEQNAQRRAELGEHLVPRFARRIREVLADRGERNAADSE